MPSVASEPLTTMAAACNELGVGGQSLRRAVKDLDIHTQYIPLTARGRGITPDDMSRLRQHFAEKRGQV